jgi:nitrogen PTS system EIIA component
MSSEVFTLAELSRHLGRHTREIERLANRGRIPGRKTESGWVFHEREITQWLERELREYTDPELKSLEESLQSPGAASDLPVSSLMRLETTQVPLEARTKRSVLESLVEAAGRTWQVWEPAKVLNAVQEREEILSTAFPEGVAVPHPRNPLPQCLGASVVAFGRTSNGIPFGGPSGGLTDLFFLVLCRDSATHLRVLARIGRMVRHVGLIEALRAAETSDDAYQLICDADREIGSG